MSLLIPAVCKIAATIPLAPCLDGLSRMHVDIGVRPGHYVTMGNALLWTLEQSLAEDFTARVKDAWSAAYQVVSALMIQADAAAMLGSVIRPQTPVPAGSAADVGTPRGPVRRPVDAVPRDAVPRDAVPRDAVPRDAVSSRHGGGDGRRCQRRSSVLAAGERPERKRSMSVRNAHRGFADLC